MKNKIKIAIVVSHPIQHFCPMYASWAGNADVDLKVFFGSSKGSKSYFDPKFNQQVAWGNLYLDKFAHTFLNGDADTPVDKNIDAVNLIPELEAFSPDVVVCYGYFHKLQQKAQAWALSQNIKLAYISDSENRRHRAWYKRLSKFFILRNKLKQFDYFLTVGDANEAYYRTYGVPDEKMIRNPFPINVFDYEQALLNREVLNNQLRKEYNIEQDAVICSVVGKVEDSKKQEDIIKALQQLDDVKQNIVLFVIGSGEAVEKLKVLAKKNKRHKVVFTGFIAPQQLIAYYALTDIYIHPSAMDAHSLAVSEAIYMACPVIISDKCGSYGINDDVQPYKNGLVYECGNIPAMGKHIRFLTENTTARAAYAAYSKTVAYNNQGTAHTIGLNALIGKFNLENHTSN